jgi:hypothetical protein
MNQDNEINAMAAVSAALATLEPAEIGRVLRWASERHGVKVAHPQPSVAPRGQLEVGRPNFDDLATLFHEADPKTDAEKALVAGYWFQVLEQQKDFESQPLNSELKNLGHGVGNITDAMTALIRRKPALVIQIQKSGTTRQARKRYKLTTTGIKHVEDMLQGISAVTS